MTSSFTSPFKPFFAPNFKAPLQATRLCLRLFPMLFLLFLAQSATGQQLSRAMHGVNMKRSHSFLNHPPPPEVLALWIDGHQVEKITGMFLEIDIIRGGLVNYQLRSIQQHELPILPPDIDYVELTWVAEKETFRYSFSKMLSLNPAILYDPLLSIPSSGDVPKNKSVFEIAIPCTKNKTGIASLYVELNITNSLNQPIPGSPLHLRIKKKCFGNNGSCHCKNGGRCLEGGLCRCQSDSYGEKCQFKTGRCGYLCKNGGACNHFNTCSCPEGYVGKFCQIPVCAHDCGTNKVCVAPGVCDCKPWTRGTDCNKTIRTHTKMDGHERRKANKLKKTRKQRQSDATQKENFSKNWKRKRISSEHRSDAVTARHPALKNRKKIKILSPNHNHIRLNNDNFGIGSNHHGYRKRYNYKRNYNYHQKYPENYNQPNSNFHRGIKNNNLNRNKIPYKRKDNDVYNNEETPNIHTNILKRTHNPRLNGHPLNKNLRTDPSHPIKHNTNNIDNYYNDGYSKKTYFYPNFNNNNNNNKNKLNSNNNNMNDSLKGNRLRSQATERKDGVQWLNKGSRKSRHKFKRKTRVRADGSSHANANRNGNVENRKRFVRRKKKSPLRSEVATNNNKNDSLDNNNNNNNNNIINNNKNNNFSKNKNGDLYVNGRHSKSRRVGRKALKNRRADRMGRNVF